MTLTESQIEKHIRDYLLEEGWRIKQNPKRKGEHGVDIYASHPKWRKSYRIEVKGENSSHSPQGMHNAFWSILGQILTRMDVEGNHIKKSRYYAIGIPKKWERVFKNKIQKMEFGWKLIKLKVFLVDSKGNVEVKPHTYFLKK